jgi:hypothetical protein
MWVFSQQTLAAAEMSIEPSMHEPSMHEPSMHNLEKDIWL